MLKRSEIKKLDSQNLLGSIEVFEKQCAEAWTKTSAMSFPPHYRAIDRIVLFGMGGSTLGMHIVQTLFADQLILPISIINDYNIPAFVNEKTLVILSSYSGQTEEVVLVSKNILAKTKNVIVITTGGELKKIAADHHLPAYIFDPQYNPSGQPRMALGYAVMGTLGILTALDLIEFSQNQVDSICVMLAKLHELHGADVPLERNPAKQLAQAMHAKIPVLVSSEFLIGSAHVLSNQINENAKQFTARYAIPELDHHLIEGLVYPLAAQAQLIFVFFQSDLYHERNFKRYDVTAEIVRHNQIAATIFKLTMTTKLEQAFELLLMGSYVSLYMAMLNNIDPSPIPNVDYLKEQLKK